MSSVLKSHCNNFFIFPPQTEMSTTTHFCSYKQQVEAALENFFQKLNKCTTESLEDLAIPNTKIDIQSTPVNSTSDNSNFR